MQGILRNLPWPWLLGGIRSEPEPELEDLYTGWVSLPLNKFPNYAGAAVRQACCLRCRRCVIWLGQPSLARCRPGKPWMAVLASCNALHLSPWCRIQTKMCLSIATPAGAVIAGSLSPHTRSPANLGLVIPKLRSGPSRIVIHASVRQELARQLSHVRTLIVSQMECTQNDLGPLWRRFAQSRSVWICTV